jgi:hypothetical protein
MAQLISNHLPIRVFQTSTNTTELTQSFLEAAGQTFLFGTPVELNGSGNVIPWDGTTVANKILGIVENNAFNLATAGAGAPPSFGSVGFPGGAPTYGTVPNQPNAVNIPAGVTFVDGRDIVALATETTIFIGQTDASTGSTYAPTTALIGTQAGLTADGNGHWYVDLAKTTPGTNTVLIILGIYPNDFAPGSSTNGVNNAQVFFTFLPSAVQLFQ